MSTEDKHCPTCICAKRAPVQKEGYPGGRGHMDGKDIPLKGAGSIEWSEHLEAYAAYSARFGSEQSAERLAERGGFGYWELTELLGHEPIHVDRRLRRGR